MYRINAIIFCLCAVVAAVCFYSMWRSGAPTSGSMVVWPILALSWALPATWRRQ